MPTSNFPSLNLYIPPATTGAPTPVVGATVKVYDVTHDVALGSTFVSDASGVVAGSTLPVAAGTVVRFRVENDGKGRATYQEVTTT